jgi:hypothetical protein
MLPPPLRLLPRSGPAIAVGAVCALSELVPRSTLSVKDTRRRSSRGHAKRSLHQPKGEMTLAQTRVR